MLLQGLIHHLALVFDGIMRRDFGQCLNMASSRLLKILDSLNCQRMIH